MQPFIESNSMKKAFPVFWHKLSQFKCQVSLRYYYRVACVHCVEIWFFHELQQTKLILLATIKTVIIGEITAVVARSTRLQMLDGQSVRVRYY